VQYQDRGIKVQYQDMLSDRRIMIIGAAMLAAV